MTGPLFRAVSEQAVLVELAAQASAESVAEVQRLDRALQTAGLFGFVESVPAFVNLLVRFDPLITDHAAVERGLRRLLGGAAVPLAEPGHRVVDICYDRDLAPDLAEVADRCGLSVPEVISAHLAGDYAVVMYGFAPGYAYLTGVAPALHLPRKPAAIRDVPAGSVIIAGAQCLVTTLTMPTGWWIIGRSPTPILRDDAVRPFLFDVGDRVAFRQMDRAAFDRARGAGPNGGMP